MKIWIGMFLISVAACSAPGEIYEGVLLGDSNLIMPISGEKVCAGNLLAHYSTGHPGSTHVSFRKGPTKWASHRFLEVDGKKFELIGKKIIRFNEEIEVWSWVRQKPKAAPESLHGWGLDRFLKSIRPTSHQRVSVFERFILCGDRLKIRAIKRDGKLEIIN